MLNKWAEVAKASDKIDIRSLADDVLLNNEKKSVLGIL